MHRRLFPELPPALLLIFSSPGLRANWLMLWVSWATCREGMRSHRLSDSWPRGARSTSTFDPASTSLASARSLWDCSTSAWSLSALVCACVHCPLGGVHSNLRSYVRSTSFAFIGFANLYRSQFNSSMYLNSPLKSKGQAKASLNYGAVAISGPDMDGLDSPKAIIRGSYVEIRAFEIAYHRIRGRILP